ncbi:hypothetical protein [Parapedobacter sp. DT-150]|uniref:hypothetical protein n=1 Tax=Parapedobacter sp. DT-150 TaxID=3396162 RepID=UPI003F1B008F
MSASITRNTFLTKEQGKIAIEGLKKDLGLRSDFHGKILNNGDLVSPRTNQVIGTFSLNVDTLRKYKESPSFEISLWIWIETNNAGIGLDLDSEELDFINCVTNKVHISFISNKEMELQY